MQDFSFVVALRIWHPSIDPEIITKQLGLSPSHQSKAGAPRITPKGRALGGVYTESYWSTDPFNGRDYRSYEDRIDEVLFDIISHLESKREFLLVLKDSGARMHLQVSTHSNRNYALVYPPELLMRSAQLGLSLVHDVYSYPQNWSVV